MHMHARYTGVGAHGHHGVNATRAAGVAYNKGTAHVTILYQRIMDTDVWAISLR